MHELQNHVTGAVRLEEAAHLHDVGCRRKARDDAGFVEERIDALPEGRDLPARAGTGRLIGGGRTAVKLGKNSLIATTSSSSVSCARYVMPNPPYPSTASILYSNSIVPRGSAAA